MKAQNEYAMADKTYSKIFLIKERALLFGCTINMGHNNNRNDVE